MFDIFFSFFKIGLISFGGGLVMIPLIQEYIETNNWILQSEFIQIIGISQMTPGPIAINSATFIGYKISGFLGAFVATIGVSLPSLLIILSISPLFFKYNNHPFMRTVFKSLKPAVAGLILFAALKVSKIALFNNEIAITNFNINTFVIAIILVIIYLKKKLHPILLITISGFLGYLSHFLV